MVSSVSASTGLPLDGRVLLELRQCGCEHVDVDDRRRAKAAALDQDGVLAQRLARLQDGTVGPEHGHTAELLRHFATG